VRAESDDLVADFVRLAVYQDQIGLDLAIAVRLGKKS
jgi:hypothetical protein